MIPEIALSHITNPLARPDQLQTTASQLDRIPADLEISIKFEGSRLIQAAGILLYLPQELIAEAVIIFSRFWLGPEGGSLAEYAAKVCMLKDSGPDVAQVLPAVMPWLLPSNLHLSPCPSSCRLLPEKSCFALQWDTRNTMMDLLSCH